MARDSSKHRVLLCDDQLIVGEGLRLMLAPILDLEIRQVTNPQELVNAVREFEPTIILQDLILPDTNGIDVTRGLRLETSLPRVPIILLSSSDDATTKAEAFRAGVNDYVVKFPHEAELLARVTYHSQAFLDHEAQIRARNMNEQRSRVEALGTLAAGIAHEINTPLQYITANLEYCLTEVAGASAEPEMASALRDALDGVTQISSIVRAMKSFAHPGHEEHVVVAIGELLHDVALLSRNEWKSRATLIVEEVAPSLRVSCSPGAITQVLVNLVVNAAQAIEANSSVPGEIKLRAYADADQVHLEVEDNGCGIPPEIQGRIFEPFFTTKERGEGSGQGLTICRSIIEEGHHGKLSFVTARAQGTTFRVSLPLEEAQTKVTAPSLSSIN